MCRRACPPRAQASAGRPRRTPGSWAFTTSTYGWIEFSVSVLTRSGGRSRRSASVRLLVDDGEYVARGEHEVILARVLHLGAAVLAVQHHVADLDVDRHALGSRVVEATRANRKDFALLGLLLGGVRDHQAGRRRLLGFERANHDPVFERLDYYLGGGRHDLTSPSGKAIGESLLERASVAACRRGCQTASSR